jgi:hypothetical protein
MQVLGIVSTVGIVAAAWAGSSWGGGGTGGAGGEALGQPQANSTLQALIRSVWG